MGLFVRNKTKTRKPYHISSMNLYVKIKFIMKIDISLVLAIIKYILKLIFFMQQEWYLIHLCLKCVPDTKCETQRALHLFKHLCKVRIWGQKPICLSKTKKDFTTVQEVTLPFLQTNLIQIFHPFIILSFALICLQT